MSDAYQEFRSLMFSMAHRMLGSASEAEDIVQEAFLRFHRETGKGTAMVAEGVPVDRHDEGSASTCVRRASAASGTSGPGCKPVLSDDEPDVAPHADTADSLSMAFLVLLESLSPVERAVFRSRVSARLWL